MARTSRSRPEGFPPDSGPGPSRVQVSRQVDTGCRVKGNRIGGRSDAPGGNRMGVFDKPFIDRVSHDELLGITDGCPCTCHTSRHVDGTPGSCNFNGGCAAHHSTPSPTMRVLFDLARPTREERDRIDRDFQLPPVSRGPRRGQIRYRTLWYHGYRDALEDSLMRVYAAMANERAGV